MGRQAKAKRERIERRLEQAPLIEEWREIPSEAEAGICRSPTCALVHCLDPWVTQCEISNDRYAGALVMVCYSVYRDGEADEVEHHLRVNGEEFGVFPPRGLYDVDEGAYHARARAITQKIVARFGPSSDMALVNHISRSPGTAERQARKTTPGYQA